MYKFCTTLMVQEVAGKPFSRTLDPKRPDCTIGETMAAVSLNSSAPSFHGFAVLCIEVGPPVLSAFFFGNFGHSRSHHPPNQIGTAEIVTMSVTVSA